jgi:transcriptional regulator with XRE-family HTH domain
MKSILNVGGYERVKIGNNIRKWRAMNDIKQKDLANALKMSEAAVSNLENDMSEITLSQLEDIAITLEIEIEHLFSDPHDVVKEKSYNNAVPAEKNEVMDKELLYALIGSIQKKDEQLKYVIDNVMYKMDNISDNVLRRKSF